MLIGNYTDYTVLSGNFAHGSVQVFSLNGMKFILGLVIASR